MVVFVDCVPAAAVATATAAAAAVEDEPDEPDDEELDDGRPVLSFGRSHVFRPVAVSKYHGSPLWRRSSQPFGGGQSSSNVMSITSLTCFTSLAFISLIVFSPVATRDADASPTDDEGTSFIAIDDDDDDDDGDDEDDTVSLAKAVGLAAPVLALALAVAVAGSASLASSPSFLGASNRFRPRFRLFRGRGEMCGDGGVGGGRGVVSTVFASILLGTNGGGFDASKR